MSGGRASSVGAPPVAGWIDPAWLEEKCDHVVCVLCFGVMVEPTSGCPEGHSFCLVCYGKALAQRRDCPTCRHAVDEKWMVRMRPLEGMISQLRMRRCEHAEEVEKDAAESSAAKRAKLAPAASNMTVEALRRELRQRGLEAAGNKPVLVARLEEDRTNRAQGGGGCGWSGGVGELAAHLGGECAWAPVKCPNQGCTESPLRKDLSAHEAICGSRQVKCRHCQMQTETRSLAAHEERCPQEDAACPNEGCRTPHPRWSMAVHLATCEHEAVVCPCEGCDEFVLRKDVDAHLEATHLCAGAGAQLLRSAYSRIAALEEDAKSEERHAAGTSSLTAMGESTLSRGVTPTTVWVFNWRADGGWERDATSKMRDNGDGLSGKDPPPATPTVLSHALHPARTI
ncbi:hypothetical protein T484DRAFT_1808111 [Baffinella frigidus]|nr:hypothetical protein T484DRAFT_1808111 [Cryptophyta sp. CCMP2293]